MQKKKIILFSILAAVLLLLIAAAVLIPSMLSDQAKTGNKDITFTVVYENGEQKAYEISTDALYLADALLEEKLITEAEYKSGFYTVIDGVEAVWANDNAWWCITEDGLMTTKGMNELIIEDGDRFEATYTKG
ncbi:MAG: DUF4430 domain-containing protein [Clostridia bacterium]|nr:DUF4430 domain-containing protein [Clostridia bacterium]